MQTNTKMNKTQFICSALLILLTFCQCNDRLKISQPQEAKISGEQTKIKKHTISYCSLERATQDFTDTVIQYSIAHFPEQQLFVYEDLKSNLFRKEVVYDSLGVSQATKWVKGVVEEKIFVEQGKGGAFRKIETFERINDSLQLSSVEKYSYSKDMVSHLYFKEYHWFYTQLDLRETLVSYEYDDLGRKASAVVKVKHRGKFTPRDSVKYFYKGDADKPYEVHRNLENGAKYYLTNLSDKTLKLETKIPDGDKVYVETEVFTFDEQNRVIEYMTNQRFEHLKYASNYQKYVITYPDNYEASYIPNLIYAIRPSFPKRNLNEHIESIVNPGFYRETAIRTDLGYNYLPKLVLGYRSSDGENWEVKSKLILY